jgi:hypothetical protein
MPARQPRLLPVAGCRSAAAAAPARCPAGEINPSWRPGHGTARLFPIIVLLPLVTVEYGGWALPGFRTGHGALGGSRKRFFAAGHAHAGALILSGVAAASLVRGGRRLRHPPHRLHRPYAWQEEIARADPSLENPEAPAAARRARHGHGLPAGAAPAA